MAINSSNIHHAVIAWAIQIALSTVCWLLKLASWPIFALCALPGVFLFFGREHAQAEAKIKKAKGETAPGITLATSLDALRFW